MSFTEIGAILADALPQYARNVPKFQLPDWLTRFLSLLDPNLKLCLMDLGIRYTVDASYVTDLTGVSFRSAKEAIEAMGNSLVEHGLLK